MSCHLTKSISAAVLLSAAIVLTGCLPVPPTPQSTTPDAGSTTRATDAPISIAANVAPAPGEDATPPVAAADPVKSLYGWGYAKLPNEPVTQLTQVVAAYAGFTVALQSDGSVVVWGGTANGEHLSPAGNNFTAVAAGLIHALALRSDGTVAAWGANFSGESTVPDGTFTAIAAGQGFSLGLRTDGSIAHWGGGSGALQTPPEGTDFTAISAGRMHGLALKADGSIVSWGATFGGLGDVPTGTDFVAIAAGAYFSIALRADGSIAAWGDNTEGQATAPAGTGYTAIAGGEAHGLALTTNGTIVRWGRRHANEDPPAGTGFKKIDAGGNHSVAIAVDDTFVGWGSDFYGESSLMPFSGYTSAAAGGEHYLAVMTDGSIRSWGRDQYGETITPPGTNYTAVAAGYGHSLALRTDGSLVGWGQNNSGQSTVPPGSDFTAIAAASQYSLALKQDGSIAAWGNSQSGITTPPAGTGFVKITAGPSHALALRQDGSMVGWGDNTSGKATARPGTGYRAVAAGPYFSLALRQDGSIEAWGDNFWTVTAPPTGTNYTAIGAGSEYAVALTTTGEIVFWGYNQGGRMTPPPGGGFTDIIAGSESILALRAGEAPPIPYIASPTTRVLDSGDLTVTVAITGDAARVERINLYFDGTLSDFRTAAPYAFPIAGVTAGPHKVTAQAVLTDGAGTTQSSRNYLYRLVAPPTFGDFVNLLEFVTEQDPTDPLGQPTPPTSATHARHTAARSVAAVVGALDLAAYERFVTEVVTPQLALPSGQYYQDLGQDMMSPLLEGIMQDPTRADPVLQTLIDWTPTLNALSDDQGNTVQITTGLAAGFQEILDTAAAAAAPELAQTLAAEGNALGLNTWSGLTADGLVTRVETQTRPAPGIVSQPGAQNTIAGGAVTLSVAGDGAGPITYQWFKDGVAIPGATGATYTVPSAQRFHAGAYTVTISNPFGNTPSNSAAFAVNAPPANDARLLNLSTRGLAAAGANQLFPGFVVSGTGTKKLLIRAIGPSLGNLVPSFTVIPDPRMELKRFNFTTNAYEDLIANDDWQTNANAADITTTAAQLFAFALTDAKDAALLVDLPAGQYAVVGGDKNGASGIGIVELYDADVGSPAARLINISNRGFCGIGDQVMIPGFVVSSEGPKTLLVRVVGPKLDFYGVPGTMTDPKLTFYRTNPVTGANTELFTQDNWSDNPDAAYTAQIATQVSAFPLDAGSADAAFVVTLDPGVYTVVGASAVAGGTGVVLVEVYVVP